MEHGAAAIVRPSTLAWVRRQLAADEQIIGIEALHGGITAEIRKLAISTPDGGTRALVLRSYVDPYYLALAEESLTGEANTLTELGATDVPTPKLVAVDATAEHCEYPSLLMTHLPGRTALADDGLEARVPALARQLVAIHALRPAERPRQYVTLSTPDTAVVPQGADEASWAAAIEAIRRPAPSSEGCFLHRDFQPGNVLFAALPSGAASAQITGVVDWAATCWGPADLDVAHCSTNLALIHGPEWSQRFATAYEEAGGTLTAAEDERLYWFTRHALAFSEEVDVISGAWRKAGRADLTTRAVELRLDAYVRLLMRDGVMARG
ncbi:aminoglycoside phosphotransferase family protein [Catenulispora yoronensis]|uniref:phosphotransferase family protein n=1 Tax=Catenulispora yoronensis TaxID=450799 RepID=UPI0031DE0046